MTEFSKNGLLALSSRLNAQWLGMGLTQRHLTFTRVLPIIWAATTSLLRDPQDIHEEPEGCAAGQANLVEHFDAFPRIESGMSV